MRVHEQIRNCCVGLAVLAAAGCGLAPVQRPTTPATGGEARSFEEPPLSEAPRAPRVGGAHLKTLQAHPTVAERIEKMLGRGRITLTTSLERSLDYIPMIEREFSEHGVPAALAYLPMVESRFRPDAVGRTAVGLWQFTRSTARLYGLKVNPRIDERRDPAKSSRAAAKYLRDLYDQFESWDLALAAYNAGPARVRRALRHRPEASFFELAQHRLLPPITRGYVPKVLAISLIGPEPATFGVHH